jgi:Flavodoxin
MIRKILLIIAGIFALILIAGIIFMNNLTSNFNHSAGNHLQILKSADETSKKAIIVYQPALSDATAKTARQIAKGLNDSGFEVTLNNPGSYLSADLTQYQVVVFGSPVYGGKLSPVLLDYMKTSKIQPDQKVVIFDTGASNNSEELGSAASLLNKNKNINTIKFMANGRDTDTSAYKLGAGY